MQTTKLFFMAALALTFAACSNDDNDIQNPAQPAKAEGITITAKLAPKANGTATRAVEDKTTYIEAKWEANEHIAILYTKDGNQMADATITAVDGTTGEATITFTLTVVPDDNTACTIVYPLSAAKDDNSGVKDAATLLAAQDGTLNANLDVRVGAGTIQTTTPSLDVTTQPVPQFAIFKFTLDGVSIDATHPLVIKNNSNTIITTITPASSVTSVFAALPEATSTTYKFIVDNNDNKYLKSGTAAIDAGKYYKTTLTMTARYPLARTSATVDDLGSMLTSDGNICLNVAGASAASKTAVAKIAYVGSSTGEGGSYYHGLALALSDAKVGTAEKFTWKTSNNSAGHTCHSISEVEGGLQYNETHNSDDYPAFQAAIANNGTPAPTGCSAWFLASGYQWKQIFTAAGGADKLGLESDYYWSSTESSNTNAHYFYTVYGSWYADRKSSECRVRACVAF